MRPLLSHDFSHHPFRLLPHIQQQQQKCYDDYEKDHHHCGMIARVSCVKEGCAKKRPSRQSNSKPTVSGENSRIEKSPTKSQFRHGAAEIHKR
jgi:hypothetical protein